MPELNPDCIASEGRNLVGFSGGPDSLCLLQLLADSRWRSSVLAVHVDHGLDDDSPRRAEAARRLAETLGFECRIEQVVVDSKTHGGPEAAARHARYARFAELLEPGDHLLTAHHADDQVETVLLRLLRGAGPRGLAGMQALRRMGPGWLGRPMLHWSRIEILARLNRRPGETPRQVPIDDPSNSALAPDRNYLRHRVLPLLHQRWPAVRRSVLQSACWQTDAAQAVRLRATHDLARLRAPAEHDPCPALHLGPWLQLPDPRALAAIRQWCADHGIEPPRLRMLGEFRRQCRRFGPDRAPALHWDGAALLAWNDRIWLEPDPGRPTAWSVRWGSDDDLSIPDGGLLRWRGVDRSSLGTDWRVTTLQPGDRIRLHHDGPRRKVSELLRELDIPPWRRSRLPCLRIDGVLRAVATLLTDPELADALQRTGARLDWRPGTTALLSSSSRPSPSDQP
jgi:tRNA(Ile)-lysidine synthase